MQIKNTLSINRLKKETIIIRQKIVNHLLDEITSSGLMIKDITHLARVNENNFIDGAITLTQFIKPCFILDISPADLFKEHYDQHEVVIK